jgi:hypothetical protein
MRRIILASALALAAATAAGAQNYSLNPAFGTVNLQAGFMPDPHTVQMTAGGTINASTISSECRGMIADAPDVRLNFTGGRISIGARSGEDTTIVVNGPDGSWYCNDDFDGFDPRVTISGSGQYDVWVGTYNGGYSEATVYFTEYHD